MKLRALPMVVLLPTSLIAWSCGSGGYGGGMTPSGPSGSSSADVTITIVGQDGNMSFSPASASVKVGQTVSWRNSDAITHSVAQDSSAGGSGGSGYGGGTGGTSGFATGDVSSGSVTTPIKMQNAGSFGYHCAIHPSMIGNIQVTQ